MTFIRGKRLPIFFTGQVNVYSKVLFKKEDVDFLWRKWVLIQMVRLKEGKRLLEALH